MFFFIYFESLGLLVHSGRYFLQFSYLLYTQKNSLGNRKLAARGVQRLFGLRSKRIRIVRETIFNSSGGIFYTLESIAIVLIYCNTSCRKCA